MLCDDQIMDSRRCLQDSCLGFGGLDALLLEPGLHDLRVISDLESPGYSGEWKPVPDV